MVVYFNPLGQPPSIDHAAGVQHTGQANPVLYTRWIVAGMKFLF
jgi:hypothetical protein